LFLFFALVAAHRIKLLGYPSLEEDQAILEADSPLRQNSENVPATAVSGATTF
jgi:hypothetical protein